MAQNSNTRHDIVQDVCFWDYYNDMNDKEPVHEDLACIVSFDVETYFKRYQLLKNKSPWCNANYEDVQYRAYLLLRQVHRWEVYDELTKVHQEYIEWHDQQYLPPYEEWPLDALSGENEIVINSLAMLLLKWLDAGTKWREMDRRIAADVFSAAWLHLD